MTKVKKVCKHDICVFKQALLVIKSCKIIFGKSRMCDITQMLVDSFFDFDANTILPGSDDGEYILISGFQIIQLSTEDKIIDFISVMGNNMIPTAIDIGRNYTYFISDE